MALKRSSTNELVEAGISAISFSGLARWDTSKSKFTPTNDDEWFEEYCGAFGPYGRWICWTLFSVGAENVIKAACVQNGYQPRTEYLPYSLPNQGASWLDSQEKLTFIKQAGKPQSAPADVEDTERLNYRALEYLLRVELPKLDMAGLEEVVSGGLRLLVDVVRNRDAHTYQPLQRQSNFYLVSQIFVPCLNIVLGTIPGSIKDYLRPTRPVVSSHNIEA